MEVVVEIGGEQGDGELGRQLGVFRTRRDTALERSRLVEYHRTVERWPTNAPGGL